MTTKIILDGYTVETYGDESPKSLLPYSEGDYVIIDNPAFTVFTRVEAVVIDLDHDERRIHVKLSSSPE